MAPFASRADPSEAFFSASPTVKHMQRNYKVTPGSLRERMVDGLVNASVIAWSAAIVSARSSASMQELGG